MSLPLAAGVLARLSAAVFLLPWPGHLAQEAAAQPLPTWWEENARSGAAGPSASPAPHVPGLAHVPGPAHPTSQHVSSCQVEVVSCSCVLQAASQAPVANVEVVSHVLQCALDVASRLRHAVSALESLNTEEARVLAYGSHVGGWAVENSLSGSVGPSMGGMPLLAQKFPTKKEKIKKIKMQKQKIKK